MEHLELVIDVSFVKLRKRGPGYRARNHSCRSLIYSFKRFGIVKSRNLFSRMAFTFPVPMYVFHLLAS